MQSLINVCGMFVIFIAACASLIALLFILRASFYFVCRIRWRWFVYRYNRDDVIGVFVEAAKAIDQIDSKLFDQVFYGIEKNYRDLLVELGRAEIVDGEFRWKETQDE